MSIAFTRGLLAVPAHFLFAIIMGYYGDEGYQGITHIEASPSQPDVYYSLSGHRLPAPQRGLNIIREADGTVRKVYRNP